MKFKNDMTLGGGGVDFVNWGGIGQIIESLNGWSISNF